MAQNSNPKDPKAPIDEHVASVASSSSSSQSQANVDQANADQANANLATGPRIRSQVGKEDLSEDDALVAEYKKKCDTRIQQINKEWDKRIQARRQQSGDAPRGLEEMWKIVFMGSPFPFLNDIDLIAKSWFYQKKLDTLNSDAKIQDKIDAIESIKNFNKASDGCGQAVTALHKKLDDYGAVGTVLQGGLKVGEGIFNLTGTTGLLSGTLDLTVGTGSALYSYLPSRAKALPELKAGMLREEQRQNQNPEDGNVFPASNSSVRQR